MTKYFRILIYEGQAKFFNITEGNSYAKKEYEKFKCSINVDDNFKYNFDNNIFKANFDEFKEKI